MQGKNKYRYAFVLLFNCLAPLVFAQGGDIVLEQNASYHLLLNNDETITGLVLEQDHEFVTIERRISYARVQVRKSTIVKATRVSAGDHYTDDPMGENPHDEMYLVSSSVLPFDRETFSTVAHWFLFDQVQYAFSENVALYVTSLTFYPCGLGLKLSKEINDLTFIGADLSGMMRVADQETGSNVLGFMAQAKLTHGTSNRNFTLGAGLFGINPDVIGQVNTGALLVTSPVVSAGFCNRFAQRWSIVMDGYYLSEENVLFGGFAFKFLRSEEISWCFGAYNYVNELGGPRPAGGQEFRLPIPYLSYCRKFL